MKKTLAAALLLGCTISISALAELPPTNQYGGYDNVENLTVAQLSEFKETPRYKEVMGGLLKEMERFDKESKALLDGEQLTTVPSLPELTVEQKSFLTKEEINSWNFARNKIKEVSDIVEKTNAKAKEIEAKANLIKEAAEKGDEQKAKSMVEIPEQMGDSFTRDKDGNLIFNPKIDMSKLPEIKIPESNCDLLDGHTK